MREVGEIRSVGSAQERVGVGVAWRVHPCGEMVAAAAAAAVPADLEVEVARVATVSLARWRRSATEVETAEAAAMAAVMAVRQQCYRWRRRCC